jgi:hypothetical protein
MVARSSAVATMATATQATATASQQQAQSDCEDWVMMFSSSPDLAAKPNSARHRESTEWLSSRADDTVQDSLPMDYAKNTAAEIGAFSFSNDAIPIPISTLW